ncbi:MAG: hypothetical protein M3N37_05775 [Actinomycetota bacterium]|nr:hypothetical protein [Actinomycetota bacterium]
MGREGGRRRLAILDRPADEVAGVLADEWEDLTDRLPSTDEGWPDFRLTRMLSAPLSETTTSTSS